MYLFLPDHTSKTMLNFYQVIRDTPGYYRQFSYGDSLITLYNCPLENQRQDIWSEQNYIICVMEGRKIWHTAHGSFDLSKGSCVFVRKGATIVEQFFDTEFCLVVFFVSDEFICDTLKARSNPLPFGNGSSSVSPVITIDKNESLNTFFNSMMYYFNSNTEPDPSLLELKFRELILSVADNAKNTELISFFHSLMHQPKLLTLQQVMESNYCFNLSLNEFARLSNRSLSAFKRDFQKQFGDSPGKWLMEKRLNHAMHLLANLGKNVNEAAFESGFENVSHFSRSFSKRFAVSPSSLRQRMVS